VTPTAAAVDRDGSVEDGGCRLLSHGIHVVIAAGVCGAEGPASASEIEVVFCSPAAPPCSTSSPSRAGEAEVQLLLHRRHVFWQLPRAAI